ncbi:MAG: cytochrome c oxidase subunit II [Steroidobacteraceae bacterium]
MQSNSTPRRVLTVLVATALAFTLPAAMAADSGWHLLNMPVGVTELSSQIYGLHMTIFWWCVAIGIFVFGWMILALVRYRKSQGAVPDTSMVHSTKAEIIWTVIPVVILVIMAIPAARVLVEIEDATKTDLNIRVTGYQWKWQYEYVGEDVSFFSTLHRDSDAARQLQSGIDPNSIPNYLLDVDNHLVIPAGRKVRLLLTAKDVIHAWWVPAFGMKKDAIPGFINELWIRVDPAKTGIYRGQCAELCGRDHGFMPIVVEVKSPEEFDAWLASRKPAPVPAAEPAAEATVAAAAATEPSPQS